MADFPVGGKSNTTSACMNHHDERDHTSLACHYNLLQSCHHLHLSHPYGPEQNLGVQEYLCWHIPLSAPTFINVNDHLI